MKEENFLSSRRDDLNSYFPLVCDQIIPKDLQNSLQGAFENLIVRGELGGRFFDQNMERVLGQALENEEEETKYEKNSNSNTSSRPGKQKQQQQPIPQPKLSYTSKTDKHIDVSFIPYSIDGYSIIGRVGGGGFGSVYLYENGDKDPSYVVGKISKGKAALSLEYEAHIYKTLQKANVLRVPKMYGFIADLRQEKARQNPIWSHSVQSKQFHVFTQYPNKPSNRTELLNGTSSQILPSDELPPMEVEMLKPQECNDAERQHQNSITKARENQGREVTLIEQKEPSTEQIALLKLEYIGPSMSKLLRIRKGKFSLKTTLMIAVQLIERIQDLHEQTLLLHRDLKPANILYHEETKSFYLVDFGLAYPYGKDIGKGYFKHMDRTEGHTFVGNHFFASEASHRGISQSRKDDLESLANILIYILKGAKSLPWIVDDKEVRTKIKLQTSIKQICSDAPHEFSVYLEYCRNLKWSETPDYKYLKELYMDCLDRHKFHLDLVFDWDV